MTLQDAILDSIRAYFDPTMDTQLSPDLGNSKYTPEFFDQLEADLTGSKEED